MSSSDSPQSKRSVEKTRSLEPPSIVGIYRVDRNNVCTFANTRCAILLGFDSPDVLIGRKMHSILYSGKDLASDGHDPIFSAAKSGEQVHFDEAFFCRTDGSSFPIECWLFPEIANQELVGCTVNFLDISERKNAAQSRLMTAKERQMQTLLNSLQSQIAYVDSDHRYVMVNQAYASNYNLSPEDFVGKHLREVIGDSSYERNAEYLEQAFAGTNVRYSEWLENNEQGQQSYLEWQFIPENGPDQEVPGVHILVADLTETKLSQKIALDQERQLLTALDAGRMGLWSWDFESEKVTWSKHLYEIFGHKEEAFVPTKESFLQIIHPEDRPQVEELFQSNLANPCAEHRIDFRIIRGDNQAVVSTHCRGVLHRDGNGRPLRITSLCMDVTERRQAEQEIQLANAKLTALFDNSRYYMGVLDLEGRLIEINDASLIPLRLERKDVLGRFIWDCPWWNAYPQTQRTLRDKFQVALKGGIFQANLKMRGAESADRICDFMYVPAKDEKGNLKFVICNGNDITESRMTVEALERANQNLHVGVAVANLGLAQIDYATNLAHLTPEAAKIYGLGEQPVSLSRAALHNLFHIEDRMNLETQIHAGLAGKTNGVIACEHRIVWPSGEIRWVEIRKQIFYDAAFDPPRPIYAILAARDVTHQHQISDSLKEAVARAQLANQSKSEFLANMSHEIRTPMTAVLGYAELALERISDSETKDYLKTIQRNGSFLLEIINDILDLSKIEAGKLEVVQESFAVHSLLEDIRSIMAVRAKEKQLSLDLIYEGQIPDSVHSDSKRIKQILFNLVGNAIKFTQKGGVKIVVQYVPSNAGAKEPIGTMLIRVEDSGVGISEQMQKELFQPFVQGHIGIAREYGGTGLGLAISRRLSQLLGGIISVQSTVEQGSVFSLQIPVPNADSVQLITPSAFTPKPQPPSHEIYSGPLDCHLLVVDDRRDIRVLLKTILSQRGATVEQAEDGEAALRVYQRSLDSGKHFDLIILDMQMPLLDGYQTAQLLRTMGCKLPIIALTAEAMEGDVNRCIQSGCNDYVTKPIDVNSFLRRVSEATAKRSRKE